MRMPKIKNCATPNCKRGAHSEGLCIVCYDNQRKRAATERRRQERESLTGYPVEEHTPQ